jgi:hypothetical protein
MKLRFNRSYWKPLVALSGAALVLSVVLATAGGVKAQVDDELSPETTPAPYAELQYATLTGTSNTINATMVPVVLSNGTIVYKNLTIPLKVTETVSGTTTTVTVTAGTVTEVASPTPQVSSFKAGTYVGPGGGSTQVINLSSPGVTSNGATEWSIAAASSATGCTYPTTGTFYVGALANNPLYARLKKAGITSTAYSYGLLGSGNTCFPGGAWYGGTIVGLSQTGNSLTIYSFTENSTQDQSTPYDQITYTLK